MEDIVDAVVIGAGQAGLATGYHLRQAGAGFLVLEAGDAAGGSWRNYYDSLTLFSPARHSSLPGMRFPGEPSRYPRRDEVTSYLQHYAQKNDLPVVPNARVISVTRGEGRFVVSTAQGHTVRARRVINATGSYGTPSSPTVDGLERFSGRVIHSSEYRAPDVFEDQRVVVVGAGNSAVQIATEVAKNARVTIATRRRIRFAPQRIAGVEVHDWLVRSGVDRLPISTGAMASKGARVIDSGRYARTIAQGSPDRRTMFRSVRKSGVVWSDGSFEPVDVVIMATGFRPTMPHLSGLAAVTANGTPLHDRGVSPEKGVGYVGLEWQRSFGSATLRGVGRDAAHVLREIGALR